MDFKYEARNMTTAEAIRGEITAVDRGAAAAAIKARGLLIIKLEDKKNPLTLESIFKRYQKVKVYELAIFSRQLETMLNSGMSIIRSLAVLEAQTNNAMFREALLKIRADVESGSSLSDAMRQYPKIFNHLYVSMVSMGEVTGELDTALQRVAEYMEKEYRLKKEIIAATRYPTVVMSFGLLAMLGLVTFILPRFVNIYHSLSPTAKLPGLTAVLSGIGTLVTQRYYILFPALFGLYLGFKKVRALPAVREKWDRLKLRMPGKLGTLVSQIIFARVSRTLSTLLITGVPIIEALGTAAQTANNVVIQEEFEKIQEKVRQGSTLARPIQQSSVFPPMFVSMVESGEESGQLGKMLVKVAEFYETEVETALKGLRSLIEPVMIIVVGCMIGIIVIGMYLPIFKVYQLIK